MDPDGNRLQLLRVCVCVCVCVCVQIILCIQKSNLSFIR